jgi:hypothetical protein
VSRDVLLGTQKGLFFIQDAKDDLGAPPARDAEIAGG